MGKIRFSILAEYSTGAKTYHATKTFDADSLRNLQSDSSVGTAFLMLIGQCERELELHRKHVPVVPPPS